MFDELLYSLKRAQNELRTQLKGIDAAIASLAGQEVHSGKRRGRPPGSKNKTDEGGDESGRKRKPRKLSAAARKAISDAQKARWARQKAGAKRKRPALGG